MFWLVAGFLLVLKIEKHNNYNMYDTIKVCSKYYRQQQSWVKYRVCIMISDAKGLIYLQ